MITMEDFLQIDLPALLSAMFACVACGVLGNLLVLRRQSLMGDAVAHVVLPGIVVAFLLSGSRSPWVMVLGATISSLVAVVLIDTIRRFGRLESGASMGVVFSILFALGVVLLEQAALENVDLDADCVLYGQLEDIMWLTPTSLGSLLTGEAWSDAPREMVTLGVLTLVSLAFVVVFFKELAITMFDGALATTQGIHAGLVRTVSMVLIAIAAVTSFEAVGSILVIAMFICPAATARMMTDRLRTQLVLSVLIAGWTGLAGYVLAAFGPMVAHSWGLIEWNHSLLASGMIATLGGVQVALAIVLAPRHGVVSRWLRTMGLAVQVAREDLLALLYRAEESGSGSVEADAAFGAVRAGVGSKLATRLALRQTRRRGLVRSDGGRLELSEDGRVVARGLVRTHRQWESYLVSELGLRPDHVHRPAMDLEHVTDERMHEELDRRAGDVDPHGKPIPRTGESAG
ncbi:MAG: metal ABC transporter permease [Phycisphaerales bacterium JB043]